MDCLLDTHTLLWFLEDSDQLPAKVRTTVMNVDNRCYISMASLWEIAIKINVGKLTIKFPFSNFIPFLAENDFELLPITFSHLLQLTTLAMHHRDPFDRIIIAQALAERLSLISRDDHFRSYPVNVL